MNWIVLMVIKNKMKQLKENTMFTKVIAFLEGKRTYATAITIGIVAALEALGYHIPEWVWIALSAAGLGFLRAGISKAIPKV